MKKNLRFGRYLFGLIALFALSSVPASAGIGAALDRSAWTVTVSSTNGGDLTATSSTTLSGSSGDNLGARAIFDDDTSTFWHSNYSGGTNGTSGNNQWILIDLGSSQSLGGIQYTPRTDGGTNGSATAYVAYVITSSDVYAAIKALSAQSTYADYASVTGFSNYATKVGEASGLTASAVKTVTFDSEQSGQYILFVITAGNGFGNCADFQVYSYAETADVTYNYYIGSVATDNLYTTTTSTVSVGFTVTAPTAPAFTTLGNYTITQGESTLDTSTEINSTDAITVNVICQESLPFNVSTDAQKYYYVMGIHSNDTGSFGSGYTYAQGEATWVISYDGSSLAKSKQPYSQNVSTFSDDYLWYVTGDLLNGFKLYNKNSGTNFLVKTSTGNSACTFGSDETYGNFKMYASTGISGDYCFKLDNDTYYINKNGDGVLQGWTDTDGGSSFHFLAVSSFPQAYYTSVIATCNDDIDENAPEGALGVRTSAAISSELITAASNAKEASEAAPFDDTKTQELVTANEAVAAEIEKITYAEVPDDLSGNYRLVNCSFGTYATYNNNGMSGSSDGTSIGSVVTISPSSTTGAYTLSVEGLNFGPVHAYNSSAWTLVSTDATSAIFTISNEKGKFTFQDGSTTADYDSWYPSYRKIAMTSSGNIEPVGWNASLANAYWYVVPADIVEVTLNTIGDAGYATAYLPFNVSVVSGATAYVGAQYKENDATILQMEETTTGVAASNGFVLVGDADGTATLTIGDATTTSNILTGTLTTLDITDSQSSYLVFGVGSSSGAAGFYQPSTSITSIPANRAYIANPTNSAIRLDFGNGTTGIEAATLLNGNDNSNAPVYDLSGRRVSKATRGLYIQGGKKYLAR